MFLSETLGKDDVVIKDELMILRNNLRSQAQQLKPAAKKQVVTELLDSLLANYGSLWQLCEQNKTSAAAAASLLRALIDSTLSCLAFCKDPATRTQLFQDFTVVLDWKSTIQDSKHLGSPLAPDTVAYRNALVGRQTAAEKSLRRCGMAFYAGKGTPTQAKVNDAIKNKKRRSFRDRWYPEARRDLLAGVSLAGVYDILYCRLSSGVHSDAAASLVLQDVRKTNIMTCATHIIGIGLWCLVAKLRFRLPATHKATLNVAINEWAR